MYKAELQTKNITPGKNTRQFIILHHTGTGYNTINGNLKTLTVGKVSVHYVIDVNGDKYKIGSTDDILWHAGISSWKGLKDMNKYSIGIEVIGPLLDVGFTKEQRISLRELVQHLMFKFNIPKENVIRHKDISPGRKIDIDDRIWINGGFKDFLDYQNSLNPKEML